MWWGVGWLVLNVFFTGATGFSHLCAMQELGVHVQSELRLYLEAWDNRIKFVSCFSVTQTSLQAKRAVEAKAQAEEQLQQVQQEQQVEQEQRKSKRSASQDAAEQALAALNESDAAISATTSPL